MPTEDIQFPVGEVAPQVPPIPIPEDQKAFMNRLRGVNGRGVFVLPDLAERVDHTGLVLDQSGLADQISVHMAPEVLAPFGTERETIPNNFTFTPKPLARFGKEKSFRGAFFGELHLTATTGKKETIPVVVKQYPIGGQHDAVHNAIQECTMLAHLKTLGMSTIDLVGVIADRYSASPTMYVVTRQRQDLESLDEISWKGIKQSDMPERLGPVIDTLSTLHSNLVFQGDPRFKNIGLGDDGTPIMFDLEHSTSMRDAVATMDPSNEQEVMDRLLRQMRTDFARVRASVEDIVYPNLPAQQRPQTPEERFEFEYTNVMEPYIMKIMESFSPHKSILEHVFARMVQQRRKELLEPPEGEDQELDRGVGAQL